VSALLISNAQGLFSRD